MADLQAWKDTLDLGSSLAIVLGIPLGLIQYFRATRKEQRDREHRAYHEVDEKYLAYQRLCLAHPELDVWDLADPPAPGEEATRGKREQQMFAILSSVFERAFLMYADESSDLKSAQWRGWHGYIDSYCRRPNFRAFWRTGMGTYDARFERYMRDRLEAAE